ncbi:MAG: hypothetical protein AAFP13_05545 [Pseudomonadota bacterium]
MAVWRVSRSCNLDAPSTAVWEALQSPATLVHVSAPLLTFRPDAPWPARWRAGRWRVRLRGPLGLPLGWQIIDVSFPKAVPPARRIRDNGRGALARRWDHLIEVAPEGNGTRYTDTVEIEAGPLGPAIWVFAHVFYAHRQRRWRRLARRL